jgi:PAS domain S-box-containing protein
MVWDWAAWDDAYQFVRKPTAAFVSRNIDDSTLRQCRANYLVYVARSGRVALAKGYDFDRLRPLAVPRELLRQLIPGKPLVAHSTDSSALKGVLRLPTEVLLVASRPVVPSLGRGPVAGTLLFARILSPKRVRELQGASGAELQVVDPSSTHLPPAAKAAVAVVTRQTSAHVRPAALGNYQSLAASTVPRLTEAPTGDYTSTLACLRDIYGGPGLLLRVHSPRLVYRLARRSVSYMLAALVLLGLAFGVVDLLLLEKGVLSRLTSLTRGVARIDGSRDLGERLPAMGRDELGTLGTAINGMLDRLHASQDQLRASEELYRRLVDEASDVVFTYNTQGWITSWNRAGEELTGYRQEEVLKMRMYDLVPEERKAWAMSQVALALSRPDQPYRGEVEVAARGGRRALVEINNRVLMENGEPRGGLAIARDVTERRKLESALSQAQKMDAIGRMAGGVAHDFNNMLAAILGYAELLLSRTDLPDTVRSFVGEISKAADRSAALTRQLLAVSRKQELRPRVLDLNSIVTSMGMMLKRLLNENLTLVCELADPLPKVRVDPSQVEQILLNLAVNARDAMPQGGILTLRTAEVRLSEKEAERLAASPGHYVVLSAEDGGCGMDPETRDRIFEPFFTTKEAGRGTGLGLSTVYGIVQQSGGCIAVESELGRGTTFSVYLPVMSDAGSSEELERGAGSVPSGKETILVAEDEHLVRAIVRETLEQSGYKVFEAASGDQALRVHEKAESPIQLLLTDVVMPGLGGPELAELIAVRDPRIAIVFMSGYTDETILKDAVDRRGRAFIQKPFSPVDLARMVRATLDDMGGSA